MSDIGLITWGPVAPGYTSARVNVYALDDSDDRVAASFTAPVTGNITHTGLFVYSVTGTPPNYNVALVAVTGTTGIPTNTPYGGGAAGTLSSPSTGWQWIELATPSAVTAGDQVGISVWPAGSPGNPDGGNYIEVSYAHLATASPYPVGGYGSSAALFSSSTNLPAFAVRYSDGSGYGWPTLSNATTAYDSADNPDEVGVKLTVPYAGRCVGFAVAFTAVGSSASFAVRLENGAGDLLAGATIADEDLVRWTTGDHGVVYLRCAPVNLAANTAYYLSVRATHATATVTPYSWSWVHASEKDCFTGGDSTVLVYRTDGGAWTEDATKCAAMGLLFDDITIGGSSPRWL